MMETLKLSGGFVGLPDSEATVPIAINELAIGGIDFISKEMEFNSGDLFSLVLVFLNGQTKLSCFVQRAQVTNVRMVEKERVVYSTFNNGLDKTAFQTIVNWVMQGREMEDGEDVEILDGDEVEEVTDTEEDTTDPFVQTLTGNPPARAVQLPRFPEQPGGLGSVVPKGGERYIETLVIDRSRALGVPELEIPILPPLPERPPDMILKASGSIRPRGESSVSQAPAGNLDEELGRAVDAWQTATGAAVDVLNAQVLSQAPTTSSVLPTEPSGNKNREEEEVVLATITPSSPTSTPQGMGSDPRVQQQSPPALPGAGNSGGGGNTPPPKSQDHDRPKRSWGWLVATNVVTAIMVFLFMNTCAGIVDVTAKPEGVVVKPKNALVLLREVQVRLPDAENREITLGAQTSTTVQSKLPQNLTVRCVPMGDHQVVVWVIPGHDKLVSSATHPDLRKDVAPAPFVLVKTLPASCRNADGTLVDFQALKTEVVEDPDAQQYVEALAERCTPKPNRGQAASVSRRDVTAGTDASARMNMVAGCNLAAKPGFAPWSSPRIGMDWDTHVRAQGKAFGTWCATCYDAPRCAAECQKAGIEFGLDHNDPSRFGDECRNTSRKKKEGEQ